MRIKPKFGLTWGGFFSFKPTWGGPNRDGGRGEGYLRERAYVINIYQFLFNLSGLFNLSVLHKELQYAEYKVQKLKYKKVGGHAA